MKIRFTIGIIGCTLLTLITHNIQQTQAGDFGTTRQPTELPEKIGNNSPSPATKVVSATNAKYVHVPFLEWCSTKKSLPAATQHTVDVLLKEAGTNNCDVATSKLKNMIGLDLRSKQISDVRPIASLYTLRELFLSKNQISDVKSLAILTKLETLHLASNQISEVKSLAALTKLETIILDGNKISDVTPLANLTELIVLGLNRNQISDVTPLANLTNLNYLLLNPTFR